MALSSKFIGYVEDLHHLFLTDLHNCALAFHWNSTAHGILSITVLTTTYNMLDDYGKLTATQVETVHFVRVTGVDL